MSKIKLTGSNSGYVEISSAADAGNLTLELPTAGTALLSNAGNVFTGITTFTGVNITDDITFNGASYNVVWDKSDNQLEFGDNAKLSFGSASPWLQLYHSGSHAFIANTGGQLAIRCNTTLHLSTDQGVDHLLATKNADVKLYFNGGQKFQTTNTGAVVTGICTATSFSGSGEGLTYTSPLSHRNIVINGDMRVAQRATSASMSDHGATYDVCDRWNYNRHGVTATIAQVADAPAGRGFKYSLKWTSTSAVGSLHAGNNLKWVYKIERQDIERLGYGSANGKTATLSFYAKGSLAGKIGVSCRHDSRIFSTNVDMTANTWQLHTIVIPVDTSSGFSANDNASGFEFGISWGAGSNSTSGTTGGNWIPFHTAYSAGFTAGQQGAYLTTSGSTFQITGVQLEMGSVATPFEHKPFSEELARCHRYFAIFPGRSGGIPFWQAYTGSSQCSCSLPIPFNMRATPTPTDKGTGTSTTTGYCYNSNGNQVNSRYANNNAPVLSCGGNAPSGLGLQMVFGSHQSGTNDVTVASWNGSSPGIFLDAEL